MDMEMNNKYVDILPEVENALIENIPIVALESTIISHGMPYPKNLEVSRRCEEIVRTYGAVPAVTAIVGGRIKVGVTSEELERLARSKDVLKVSRRDIPTALTNGSDGATTVAAAIMIADMAGIRVFATGGIGGVHRNVEDTWDISADLQELEKANVCVVCAGVKSILDIGKTLEYLETIGVQVMAYQTQEFPAFYSVESGYQANYMATSADDVARIFKMKMDMGIDGGILVGNPVQREYAMEKAVVDAAIEQAISEANVKGVTGREITPYLLSRILSLTDGQSLNSNTQLVWNNCKVAAQIAVSLTGITQEKEIRQYLARMPKP